MFIRYIYTIIQFHLTKQFFYTSTSLSIKRNYQNDQLYLSTTKFQFPFQYLSNLRRLSKIFK